MKRMPPNNIAALLFGLFVYAIFACGTDTPLSEYTPTSEQETAIKSLLLEFEDGVNRQNDTKVAGLIHKDAVLMLGRERSRVSKADYVKILPQRLADQPPIALGRPKMDIKGDTADIRIYLSRGNGRFLVTYHLRRDDHLWFISGWTY